MNALGDQQELSSNKETIINGNGTTHLAHVLTDEPAQRKTYDVIIQENLKFENLLLSEPVLKGLRGAGFVVPSPIQVKAIPPGRCGIDLVVQAKSGTGKTCVFTVIALESIAVVNMSTQVVIVAPTREIAQQIHTTVQTIGSFFPGLRCACLIGGISVRSSKAAVKNCHIAIGTPGRIMQLMQEHCLSTQNVRLLVLDEADKLMESNARAHINWIFSKLPDNKQLVVTSATFPRSLDEFFKQYMHSPLLVKLDNKEVQLLGVKQYFVAAEDLTDDSVVLKGCTMSEFMMRKALALHVLLGAIAFNQCMVFCNYQDRAERLCDGLKALDWPATFITASLSQDVRTDIVRKLKQFECRILVTTDLTARGIDSEHVNLVVNFDVPVNIETYFHRIGRAGRYGGYGAAVSLLGGSAEQEKFASMALEGSFLVKYLKSVRKDLVTNSAHWDNMPEIKSIDSRRACEESRSLAKRNCLIGDAPVVSHSHVIRTVERRSTTTLNCPSYSRSHMLALRSEEQCSCSRACSLCLSRLSTLMGLHVNDNESGCIVHVCRPPTVEVFVQQCNPMISAHKYSRNELLSLRNIPADSTFLKGLRLHDDFRRCTGKASDDKVALMRNSSRNVVRTDVAGDVSVLNLNDAQMQINGTAPKYQRAKLTAVRKQLKSNAALPSSVVVEAGRTAFVQQEIGLYSYLDFVDDCAVDSQPVATLPEIRNTISSVEASMPSPAEGSQSSTSAAASTTSIPMRKREVNLIPRAQFSEGSLDVATYKELEERRRGFAGFDSTTIIARRAAHRVVSNPQFRKEAYSARLVVNAAIDTFMRDVRWSMLSPVPTNMHYKQPQDKSTLTDAVNVITATRVSCSTQTVEPKRLVVHQSTDTPVEPKRLVVHQSTDTPEWSCDDSHGIHKTVPPSSASVRMRSSHDQSSSVWSGTGRRLLLHDLQQPSSSRNVYGFDRTVDKYKQINAYIRLMSRCGE